MLKEILRSKKEEEGGVRMYIEECKTISDRTIGLQG
jgi:hypothetical protein